MMQLIYLPTNKQTQDKTWTLPSVERENEISGPALNDWRKLVPFLCACSKHLAVHKFLRHG